MKEIAIAYAKKCIVVCCFTTYISDNMLHFFQFSFPLEHPAIFLLIRVNVNQFGNLQCDTRFLQEKGKLKNNFIPPLSVFYRMTG